MSSSSYHTDILVVGAGPVGVFTAFQAGMLNMKCHIVDALPEIGGQCAALYSEKPIYDIPAYPVITAAQLVENLVKQAAPFNPVYHLNHTVVDIISDSNSDSCLVLTDKGLNIHCKAVVIAAGCGAFGPKRPPLDGIEHYEGKSVFYGVDRIADFKDKKIVIAGGGDSAADWAVELAKVAQKVHLIHRRKAFRCAPDTEIKLKELAILSRVNLVVPYQLGALQGQQGKLEAVIVRNLNGQDEKVIEADVLLAFFGIASSLGPILNWGVSLDSHHIVVDPATCRTNRERIYAVGDIASYLNKVKLILTGFAEVTMACHDLYRVIFPNSPRNFQHSTSKGIPAHNSLLQ